MGRDQGAVQVAVVSRRLACVAFAAIIVLPSPSLARRGIDARQAAPKERSSSSEKGGGRDRREFRVGALGGATFGYTDLDNDYDRIKPFGGVRSEYVWRSGLGVQLGLQWSPKGFGYNPLIPEYQNGVFRSTYLAAPARVVYRFRESRRLPSIVALGVESAYLIDAYYQFEDSDGNVMWEDVTDDVEHWDFGISVGTAVGLSSATEIGLEYVHGLRPLYWFGYHNRSLWLSMTVWFDLI